ncbi:STAS domain-containing protein [Andreprevotia chitinilytica]|uniref:STAS domain-containing protein n=1 Tax=Andreprevotia chitinilytica TaxID=396808 RepID=UPI000550F32A|nr:STAS domain-containing protein [Andreprevotia chitinilytica]
MSTQALTGRLTLDTASARLGDVVWPAAGEALTLDLSGVDAGDSAGVSLLLHWLREAQARRVSLSLAGVPDGLLQLAGLYGVSPWIDSIRKQ